MKSGTPTCLSIKDLFYPCSLNQNSEPWLRSRSETDENGQIGISSLAIVADNRNEDLTLVLLQFARRMRADGKPCSVAMFFLGAWAATQRRLSVRDRQRHGDPDASYQTWT